MKRLIEAERSILVALDVPSVVEAANIVSAVRDVPGIGGFKVGFGLGLDGLRRTVSVIRSAYGKDTVIIYDHQKAATDIPETGRLFASKICEAGCDAAILFPHTGPVTQSEWTRACMDAGLRVIIGLAMTHPGFFASEGGYIADDAPERAFRLACRQGVRDFVVPGTRLDWVQKLRSVLENELAGDDFDLYAPGFITQGGDVSECARAAGKRFHAIVGSGIYRHASRDERRAAARQLAANLAA